MTERRRFAGCLTLCALAAGTPLLAQTSIAAAMLTRERSSLLKTAPIETDSEVTQPATSLEAALQASFAHAGVIFTGEVLSVEQTPGAVIVRWRVDDAVRGVAAGAIFEQKEWPGLWADGSVRYRAGERALVLLSAPSVGGYTSPVGDGVIPMRGDAITGTLDLRWMAAQVAVTDAARLRPMLALRAAGGDLAMSDVLQKRSAQGVSVPHAEGLLSLPSGEGSSSNGASAVILQPPASSEQGDVNAQVDGAMILGMLHAWQRTGVAGR